MLTASGLLVRAGRGDLAALEVLPGLAPHGRREGMVALFAGFAAIDLYGDSGNLTASLDAHDTLVAELGEIWDNKDFQARIRLAGLVIGQLANAVPTTASDDHDDLLATAATLTDAAERVVRIASSPDSSEGPEGRAWLARARAEHLRLRWLVGRDAPGQDELRGSWRSTVDAFTELRHAFEVARSQARLAAVLRAGGDVGRGDRARRRRPGRPPARSAPSRCCASCARSAARCRRAGRAATAAAATTPSPRASSRCSRWSPRAAATARSPASSTSAPRRSASTCPTCWPSSAWAGAPRRSPSPAAAATSTT